MTDGLVKYQVTKKAALEDEKEKPEKRSESNFEEIGQELGRITGQKHIAYNRSLERIGEVLKFFYPDGIKVEQYHDLQIVVRLLDKLFRLTGPDPGAFEESPYKDIAGYGIAGYGISKGMDKSKGWCKP